MVNAFESYASEIDILVLFIDSKSKYYILKEDLLILCSQS